MAILELPIGNSSSVNQISELLHRNDVARLSAEMTGQQIRQLLEDTRISEDSSSQRYPYEIGVGLFILMLATAYLEYRSMLLGWRLVVHEKHDEIPMENEGLLEMVTPNV